MYLKTLNLKGFKSFADSTTLDLEPGVTVVVGPNGSGKSNVVDALAWVLGAQAPSAVRSQKMDDVIFAGTDKRAALGRAEVSITIDNASGMLPIEFTEVTVTRTLFRTGESEYSINGVPCRLLDIQDLLSDSGVGRQQHVIVSQGQIDAVLNAKPEERRYVIEEAAGVLKYRKRKEKSERRLAATEANLTRLQDLLREIRRQLRPLERQADAARRHGAVVAELSTIRRHLAGNELKALQARALAAIEQRKQHAATDAELTKALGALDAEVLHAEARLTAAGGDDLADDLATFESLHERARGLTALVEERRRSVDRERNASVDEGVVATLEAEAARLASELEDVNAEIEALGPARKELADAEAVLAARRAAFETDWSDGVPLPSGQAAEVRGELAAVKGTLERNVTESDRLRARLEGLASTSERLAAEADQLRDELSACEQAELPLVESMEGAEQWQADATAALEAAKVLLRDAQAELSTWTARSEALALALDEARSRAGAERLAEVDGVLGTLLDLVDVDPGWEAPFEAAAGEALAAVVVASPDAAREALAALHSEAIAGAVLALGPSRVSPSTPPVGESVRARVRATRAGVDELLDALVGSAVVVDGGWQEALELSLTHPELIVVTPDGDRFGATGWRVGVAGAGATGAALEDAEAHVARARAAVDDASNRVEEAASAHKEATAAERELSRKLDDNDERMTAAADSLQRVESERREAQTEAESLRAQLAELDERIASTQQRVSELEGQLPLLEAADEENRAEARRMADARSALEEQAASVGAMRADLDVRSAGSEERRQFLTRRLEEVEARLERSAAEREDAAKRRVGLDRRAGALDSIGALLGERQAVIDEQLADLRERRRAQSEATRAVAAELEDLRRRRAEAERELAKTRELSQRTEIEEAEVRLRIEAATEALRNDLDCEPDQAMATECPPLPDGVTAQARRRELERDLRIMGPINPLALEEFEALQERHEFVQSQLDDVKESRRELAKIIRAIDEEIVNVFAAAFADVSANFEHLFGTLFPGGKGRLKLTQPDDLLATGIEVEAKPSGKNVKKLSLLSGGERSLTALAYLFAVFRSRPSPFYVMDEVEAALDDVNLHRFLGLIQEFRDDAQLIIVSHQKRTMEAADSLYGVTMQPGGSSKVVSEKAGSAS